MTPEEKAWIDNATITELLRKWRFEPSNSGYFQGKRGDYFSKVLSEHHRNRPDTIGDELGNNVRCFFCGASAGKQCVKADGKFRNYPHQKRRDLARATTTEAK